MQCPLKLAIRRAQQADIVAEVTAAMAAAGDEEILIRVDTSVGVLRERSVGWLVKAYNEVNNPEMVKKVSSGQKINCRRS